MTLKSLGMSVIATRMMDKRMEGSDFSELPELTEMITHTGCGMYPYKTLVDLFGFTKHAFISQAQEVITVGES